MELTQIRYFLEVANSLHVTNSAKKLHIAQPALTQSIHRFEKELGVPLFTAKGRNIILTEYGAFLKEKLEPIMKKMDDIPEQLKTMAALENDTIHLNVLAASTLLTEAIIKYKTINHHVNFQFFQSTESELYDIGITTKMFCTFCEDSAKDKFVCTEKIYLAVPNTEKYKGIKQINLLDLKEEKFIALLGSKQLRWICDKFCLSVGFEPNIIFESDNPTAVKNMISTNMGVGFWPAHSWGKIDGDNVKLLEIENPLCQRDLLFTCKHNKNDNKNVEHFFAYLREYVNEVMEAPII